MRLLFPVLALPLLMPAASAAETPAPASPKFVFEGSPAPPVPVRDMPVIDPIARNQLNCPSTSRYEAAKRGGKLGPQKLNELPMADGYKAVLRRVDGCNAPIIVSYGFGREQR
jgi:hypothetical protein